MTTTAAGMRASGYRPARVADVRPFGIASDGVVRAAVRADGRLWPVQTNNAAVPAVGMRR